MKLSKQTRKTEKHEQYLYAIFTMIKKREALALSAKRTHFSDTELRLIAEVLSATYEGKRLISTQLATLLGVTRSAISQIVNRLEEQGVVRRVADEVDRKIAYIEVTEGVLETYKDDLKLCAEFIGSVVEEFGEENFFTMAKLFGDFIDLIEEKKATFDCEKCKSSKK